jgi:hypothetical protein
VPTVTAWFVVIFPIGYFAIDDSFAHFPPLIEMLEDTKFGGGERSASLAGLTPLVFGKEDKIYVKLIHI